MSRASRGSACGHAIRPGIDAPPAYAVRSSPALRHRARQYHPARALRISPEKWQRREPETAAREPGPALQAGQGERRGHDRARRHLLEQEEPAPPDQGRGRLPLSAAARPRGAPRTSSSMRGTISSKHGFAATVLHIPGHSRGSGGVLTGPMGPSSRGDLLEYRGRPVLNNIIDDRAAAQSSLAADGAHGVPGHGPPFPGEMLRREPGLPHRGGNRSLHYV